MRHIPICLVVPFVLACGLFGPSGPFIQLEGTVTALDDGSPIIGARVRVWEAKGFFDIRDWGFATTGTAGRYALSFSTEGIGCREDEFLITISANNGKFWLLAREAGNSGIRCTDELQTLDFQLTRFTIS